MWAVRLPVQRPGIGGPGVVHRPQQRLPGHESGAVEGAVAGDDVVVRGVDIDARGRRCRFSGTNREDSMKASQAVARAASGRRTTTRLPRPGPSECSVTVPPCATTIERLMVSPMPEPPPSPASSPDRYRSGGWAR